MRVTLWGTRGSLATPGLDTVRYGGNTSCVELVGRAGTRLVLDAGTGIRRLAATLRPAVPRVDLLLSHLHLDHIQGLGFFWPIDFPGQPIHIWGPPSASFDLRTRLGRYFSPPLFPVRLRELPGALALHDVAADGFEVGEFRVSAALVCHPGPTVGYRIGDGRVTVAYIPDHEPALGSRHFPDRPEWTSGYDLAKGADLLIHDTQYSPAEYPQRIGWGHSAIDHAIRFAAAAGVARLVTFHHDPEHDDETIDRLHADVRGAGALPFEMIPGVEGTVIDL